MSSSANILQPPTYQPATFITSLPISATEIRSGTVSKIPEWMKSAIDTTAVKESQERSVRKALKEDGPPEQMKIAKLMDSAYNASIRKSRIVEQMGGASNDIVGKEQAMAADAVVISESTPLVPIDDVVKEKEKGVAKQLCKCKQAGSSGKRLVSKQWKKSSSSSSAKGAKKLVHQKSKKSTKQQKKSTTTSGSKNKGGWRKKGGKTAKKKEKVTQRKVTKRPKSQKNPSKKKATAKLHHRSQTAKHRLMF